MSDVFISYSRRDRDYARNLAELISSLGINVWWDHALLPNDQFRDAIQTKLERANAVIVLWSRDSAASPFVVDEADVARKDNKLVSVLVDEFSSGSIPIGLRGTHACHLAEPGKILDALSALGVRGERAQSLLLSLFAEHIGSLRRSRAKKRRLPYVIAAAALCIAAGAGSVMTHLSRSTGDQPGSPIALILGDTASVSVDDRAGTKEYFLAYTFVPLRDMYVSGMNVVIYDDHGGELYAYTEKKLRRVASGVDWKAPLGKKGIEALDRGGHLLFCASISGTENGPFQDRGQVWKIEEFSNPQDLLAGPGPRLRLTQPELPNEKSLRAKTGCLLRF